MTLYVDNFSGIWNARAAAFSEILNPALSRDLTIFCASFIFCIRFAKTPIIAPLIFPGYFKSVLLNRIALEYGYSVLRLVNTVSQSQEEEEEIGNRRRRRSESRRRGSSAHEVAQTEATLLSAMKLKVPSDYTEL